MVIHVVDSLTMSHKQNLGQHGQQSHYFDQSQVPQTRFGGDIVCGIMTLSNLISLIGQG